jgi:hypothetical protein
MEEKKMTNKEIAIKRAKAAADKIFYEWEIGYYTAMLAHEELDRLNVAIFAACEFGLMVVDLDEMQDYIHELQGKLVE